MRHDYSLLFSVAALGLVFGRQPGLVPKMSLGPSTADVLPREQAAGRDRTERMSAGAARWKKQEGNELMKDGSIDDNWEDTSMMWAAQQAARNVGRPTFGKAGFSLTELTVFIAVVGVLFVMTVPFFISYYQAAAARADVQQVMTLFNQARELAIRQNNTVCVTLPNNGQMVILQGSCAGAAWTGAGTDVAGNINLPQGFTISPLNNVTFNYLGAAGAATTYTMTNSTTGALTTISIALTGRVTSP